MGTTGLALSIAPALLWLVHLRRKDRYEPEPWLPLLAVLLLGAGAAMLVGWARPRVEACADLLRLDSAWAEAYLVTALPEEAAKLAAVALGAVWLSEWDERVDGILYGAAAALGFAAVENVYYLLESQSFGVVLARTFTAELGHVIFTATSGFLLGLAKLDARMRWRCAVCALLAAVGLHGTYDWMLGGGDRAALLALILFLPLGLVLLSLKLRWALTRSPYRPLRLART
jgi:RsiW-degrading membrane proteinase PrsW (M82 family)